MNAVMVKEDNGYYQIAGEPEVWADVLAVADNEPELVEKELRGWGGYTQAFKVEVNGCESFYFVNENLKHQFVTGPFEGNMIDDGGQWMESLGCESYEEADEDLQARARDWAAENGKDPVRDWDLWLKSWETVEI